MIASILVNENQGSLSNGMARVASEEGTMGNEAMTTAWRQAAATRGTRDRLPVQGRGRTMRPLGHARTLIQAATFRPGPGFQVGCRIEPGSHTESSVRACALALLLGGLSLIPAHASATDIPFYVSSEASVSVCLNCQGPWFRGSPTPIVAPSTQRLNFYNAEVDIFSPFGFWHCTAEFVPAGEDCLGSDPFPNAAVNFCVDARQSLEVDLTVSGGRDSLSLAANGTPPPCNSTAAAAFLGDATPARRRDHDVFRFDGEAGETITLSLERDGASGSAGEIAELTLRAERGTALDEQSGALPLELTATLPETGSYAIEASEVGTSARGSASPFRGHFLLTVTSDAGERRSESLLLEPAEHTEP